MAPLRTVSRSAAPDLVAAEAEAAATITVALALEAGLLATTLATVAEAEAAPAAPAIVVGAPPAALAAGLMLIPELTLPTEPAEPAEPALPAPLEPPALAALEGEAEKEQMNPALGSVGSDETHLDTKHFVSLCPMRI